MLRIRDVECPELLGQLSLMYLMCSLRILSRSDRWILSTYYLKPVLATHSFDPHDLPSSPVALLLYELSCSKGISRALRVIVESPLRVSAANLLLRRTLGLV